MKLLTIIFTLVFFSSACFSNDGTRLSAKEQVRKDFMELGEVSLYSNNVFEYLESFTEGAEEQVIAASKTLKIEEIEIPLSNEEVLF